MLDQLGLLDHTDDRPTLQMVAEMTAEMLAAQLCLVLTFQEESHILKVRAASTGDGARVEASVDLSGDSLAARAIERGRPAWVTQGIEPPRLFPRELNARLSPQSGIAVPIREGARVTGVILVYHGEPRAYSPDEVQVLTALAAQASAAIRNCALYEHQRAIAETIRRSLVPRLPASLEGMALGHAYLPRRDHIGGDYFDMIPLAGGRYGIVVGDVSGSGLPAAVHTAMGKYMLRAFASESPSPGTVLRKLNDAICSQSQSEVFLTVFYAVLDPSGRLVYANGAHPHPIIRRAARGALSTLDTTGTVVGIIPEQTYRDRETRLHRGDVLLLHTDGVTDAESRGQRYGWERLQACARRWQGDRPQGLVDTILASVREFTGGSLQDDVALLAIKLR